MFSWKSFWKPWTGDSQKPPEKDEKLIVAESLMLELEYNIKETERLFREKEQEEKRQQTGVDYSWLISAPVKTYEIPQLVRLELEELCYQVKPEECGRIISLFRDSCLNEPAISEMPRIMKACIRQVISQRPKEESLTEWVTKRTASLTNIKLRPQTKITPFLEDRDDIESQATLDTVSSRVESVSSSYFKAHTLPRDDGHMSVDNLPI